MKKPMILITLLMLAAVVPLVGTGPTVSGNQGTEDDTGNSDLNYTYGAYLEPPEDRILHGIGQWNNGNANFLAALDNLSATAQLPASELTFLSLDDNEDDVRGWNWSLNALTENLANGEFEGRIPSLSLALRGEHLSGDDYYEGYGIDELVATTDEYDYRIQQYIDMVMDYGQPVFLRIGGEFSGFWNGYEPVMYPIAFRKIVQMFRDSGADNVAFVWCYEPAAPGNFAEVDHDGNYLWFPGNDVIDWYGIDVFHTNEFSGGGVKHERTEAFLEMALDAGKPVVVAETTARDTIITNDSEMATSYWDEWFDLFFTWLNDHEQIKAFHYINVDWTVLGHYGEAGWGQADMSVNPALMQMFVDEISGEQYLHLSEIADLNGYGATNGNNGTNGTITDSDGDGIADSSDQCEGYDDNADSDGDGIPDGCDSTDDTPPADSDADGVSDEADTCADTPAGSTVDANGCAPSQLDSGEDQDIVSEEGGGLPGFSLLLTLVSIVGALAVSRQKREQ